MDRYFQTARYLDESVEQFFNSLKASGLYEDSVIFLYGDHYGVSTNHNRAMSELLGEDITNLKSAELQRVPFLIKIPGMEGQGINHEYTGQMDVVPTILHLLGIEARDYIQFGTDLFSEEHKDFVPFRNGDFMTEKFSRVDGVYYDNQTKDVIEEPTEEMKDLRDTVMQELELSDQVLYGDLLRFYTPNSRLDTCRSDEVYVRKIREQNKGTVPHSGKVVKTKVANIKRPSAYSFYSLTE